MSFKTSRNPTVGFKHMLDDQMIPVLAEDLVLAMGGPDFSPVRVRMAGAGATHP